MGIMTTDRFDATIFGINATINGIILCILAYFSHININTQNGVVLLTIYITMYLAITIGMSFLLIYFFNSKNFKSLYAHTLVEKTIYVCLLLTCVCNCVIFYFCEFKKIINGNVGVSLLLWLPTNLILGYLGYVFYSYKLLQKFVSIITAKKLPTIILIEEKKA